MILRIALVLLVSFHIFIAAANLAAFFIIPFYQHWTISIPIMSLIFTMSLAKFWKCQLTEWENDIRGKLGMRKIGGFLGHYVVRPIKITLGAKRGKT
ncbi:MAG: DUF2784 family protein [Nitrososphaerales archaeon]